MTTRRRTDPRAAGRLMLATALLAPLGVLGVAWAPARDVASLARRWAPPPSRFVAIDGMRVHVRDEGPKDATQPPVVLLHGTLSSLHTWDGWARDLARDRRVIRFDLPGFGLTGPAPDGDEGLARMVRTTFALLDSLGVRRAVLAGNSLGGAVAWEAALASPARVAGLVLVDAVGYTQEKRPIPPGFRVADLPVLRQLTEELLPKPLVEIGLREAYGDPSRLDEEVVTRYWQLARREGNRLALVRRALKLPSDWSPQRLRTLDIPTLIVWGGRDRLIPPVHADSFHHDLARSKVVVLPELGHVPHEEDPAASVAPVREFLGRLPGVLGVAAVPATHAGIAAAP